MSAWICRLSNGKAAPKADIGRPHEIVRFDTAGITNCHIALQHSLTMYRFQTIALVLQK